jgi:hypothetical protein
MKSKWPLLFFVFFLLLACSKDQNSGKPSISIKSYTSTVAPGADQYFSAVLNYSQSGGNLSNDTLTIIRHRYNQTPIPPDIQQSSSDTFVTLLPVVPDASKAEFTASLAWPSISYGINGENDTLDFRFILTDLKGQKSDTAVTGKVIVLQ